MLIVSESVPSEIVVLSETMIIKMDNLMSLLKLHVESVKLYKKNDNDLIWENRITLSVTLQKYRDYTNPARLLSYGFRMSFLRALELPLIRTYF